MKKSILLLLIVLLFSLILAVSGQTVELSQTNDLNNVLSNATIENKTVMLVFDQDNCVYCDMFKKDTLNNLEVQKALNESFIVVMVDINKNPDLANKYHVFGTPASVFLNGNGSEIHRIDGYVGASEFLSELRKI